VGCTAEENEVGGVAVQALELNNFDVAYYFARYGSVLAALSRPGQNYCPEALEVMAELKVSYSGDPTLMSIVAENESICYSLEATPAP
jgi:hypothetical protein